MNFSNTRYYEILGVTHDASFESISRAKDRLKFGDDDDRVPFSEWAKIDEAYNVLYDPDKRKEYDKFLAQQTEEVTRAQAEAEEAARAQAEAEEAARAQAEAEEAARAQAEAEEAARAQAEAEEAARAQAEAEEAARAQAEAEEAARAQAVTPFIPVNQKFKNMSFENKLKIIGKHTAVSIVALPIGGPIGVIALNIWMAKRKGKIKLQKDKKPKKITEVKTSELQAFKQYEEKLNQEIDKLLAEPHNDYKLEINRKKYENQIELYKKILEIRLSKNLKSKFDIFKNKLEVMSVAKQLESASKNLEKVSKKIENYDESKTPKLSKLNQELIDTNMEIAERVQESQRETYGIKKLKIKQSKLLKKRNEVGTSVKARVVRQGKFYDWAARAKNFVTNTPYIFVSSEDIDDKIDIIERAVEEIENRRIV